MWQKKSQELTRVNRNIFSINVELTSTFLLYRGLVHHHHPILKFLQYYCSSLMTQKFCELWSVFWRCAFSFIPYISFILCIYKSFAIICQLTHLLNFFGLFCRVKFGRQKSVFFIWPFFNVMHGMEHNAFIFWMTDLSLTEIIQIQLALAGHILIKFIYN